MRKREPQKSLHQTFQEAKESTDETVELLRRMSKASKGYEYSVEDAEYGITEGSRSIGRKILLSLRNLGDIFRQQMIYSSLWMVKILLIIVFNVVAVFVFFWLLSLL